MNESRERRRSYRLDDNIKLRVRVLDSKDLDTQLEEFDANRKQYRFHSHFLSELETRERQLDLIKHSHPEIGSYLDYLGQQLCKLTELQESETDEDAQDVGHEAFVNISASGIRFLTKQELSSGMYVELGMLLPTTLTQVMLIAEVVRSEKNAVGEWSVSLQYTRIDEEDKEAIIGHMARAQQQQLQAKRAG
ncbi:MAG: PilZ domain-containing protein [Granulosicoccus sp.]